MKQILKTLKRRVEIGKIGKNTYLLDQGKRYLSLACLFCALSFCIVTSAFGARTTYSGTAISGLATLISNSNPGDTIVLSSSGGSVPPSSGSDASSIAISSAGTYNLIANPGAPVVILSKSGRRHIAVTASGNTTLNFENVILDGGGVSGGIVTWVTANDVTINGAIIQNCYHGYWGAGIYGDELGALTLNSCIIRNNTCNGPGGGICCIAYNNSNSAILIIENCTIINNKSVTSGGGISADGPTLSGRQPNRTWLRINNSTISNNEATNNAGGGVHSGDETVITNSIINNNKCGSGYGGGGIFHGGVGLLTVDSCTISHNTAEGTSANYSMCGGGIYHYGDILTVTNSTITDNQAIVTDAAGYGVGGGIGWNLCTQAVIQNCTIKDNMASRYGGGIYDGPTYSKSWGSGGSNDINIENCIISDNTAGDAGGGFYSNYTNSWARSFTITNSTIGGDNVSDGNIAETGIGGGICTNIPLTVASGMVIKNNSAGTDGGGIYAAPGCTVTADGTAKFISNKAGHEGGGIYIENNASNSNAAYSGLTVGPDVTFSGNTANNPYWLEIESPTSANYRKPWTVANIMSWHGASQNIKTTSRSAPPAGNAPFTYLYNNYDVNFVGTKTTNPECSPDWARLKSWVEDASGPATITLYKSTSGQTENKANGTFVLCENVDLINSDGTTINAGRNVTIQSANASDTIRLYTPSPVTTRHFNVTAGNFTLQNVVIDGRGVAGGISASSGTTLTINTGAIIRNCNAPGSSGEGGGIYASGQATITLNSGSIIENNISGREGGGIYIYGGFNTCALNINTGAIIRNNVGCNESNETTGGGGIYIGYGTLTMTGGTISGNTGKSYYTRGGGIYVLNATLNISGGAIQGNYTQSLGGGICGKGTLNISDSAVIGGTQNFPAGRTTGIDGAYGNRSDGNGGGVGGGAIYWDGQITMSGGTISYNSIAILSGGGIALRDGTGNKFTMTGGTISNNSASDGNGGGIVSMGDIDFSGGEIKDNSAFMSGGGIYVDNYVNTVKIYGTAKITGNSANGSATMQYGGGGIWIAYADLPKLTVASTVTFSGNTAKEDFLRLPEDDALYNSTISKPNGTWSNTGASDSDLQGYNNYDISYFRVAVIFDKNHSDASGWTDANPTRRIVNCGNYIGTAPTNPTRTNYSFKNWSLDSNGVGTTVVFGSFSPALQILNRSVKCYAQWTKNGPIAWEIWNWEDLAYINTLIFNEYKSGGTPAQGNGDKLSDYDVFRVMQNIGRPDEASVGDGTGMSAAVQATHTGDRRFGWFGYEGFAGTTPSATPYSSVVVVTAQAAAQAAFAGRTPTTDFGWDATKGWTPIGDFRRVSSTYKTPTPFAGIFDGNSKTISGLWINRSAETTVGLFGAIGYFPNYDYTGELSMSDLNIVVDNRKIISTWNYNSSDVNPNITTDGGGTEFGVGALVGHVHYSPYTKVKISNIKTSGGEIVSDDSYAGGAIGSMTEGILSGTFSNTCPVKSTSVSGWGDYGGIVGFFKDSEIEQGTSLTNGGIITAHGGAGGIMGACTVAEDVTFDGTTASPALVYVKSTAEVRYPTDVTFNTAYSSGTNGGVFGILNGSNGATVVFQNYDNTVPVSGYGSVGGIIGGSSNGILKGRLTNNSNVTTIYSAGGSGVPGTGGIASAWGNGSSGPNGYADDGTYLYNSGTISGNSVGGIFGFYNGRGCIFDGFAGQTTPPAGSTNKVWVRNDGLIKMYSPNTQRSQGVGSVFGVLSYSQFSSPVTYSTIQNYENNIPVEGYQRVGGIVGYIDGVTLAGNLTNNAAVTAFYDDNAWSITNNFADAGGIVGSTGSYTFINNDFKISDGTILRNTGTITGAGRTGGIFGHYNSGTSKIFDGSASVGTNVVKIENTGNVLFPNDGRTRDNADAYDYTGGFVGNLYSDGTIVQNFINTVNVSAKRFGAGIAGCLNRTSSISNCANKGTISSISYAGGLVGRFLGTGSVSNSYNRGQVIGNGSSGGVIAYMENYNGSGTLSNVYNLGDISGVNAAGVIGYITDTDNHIISNVYNAGRIKGTSNSYGVIGVYNTGAGTTTVSNSYFDTTTSQTAAGFPVNFDNTGNKIQGLTTEGMTKLAGAWRTAPWGANIPGFDTYPYLDWQRTNATAVQNYLTFTSITPKADRTASSTTASVNLTGAANPAKYAFNPFATTAAGYYPTLTAGSNNSLAINATAGVTPVSVGAMSESDIVAFEIMVTYTITYKPGPRASGADKSEAGGEDYEIKDNSFTGFTGPVGEAILYWEGNDGKKYFPGDIIDVENDLVLTAVWSDAWEIWNWEDLSKVTQKQNEGFTKFKVMQNIGVPGQSNYGDGQGSCGEIMSTDNPRYGTDKQFGWYGYEGFTGNGNGIDDDVAMFTAYQATAWTSILAWTKATGWTPIGSSTTPFAGEFIGGGHVISGLWTNSTANNVGLFGYTTGASISQLGINTGGTGVSGGNYVGGLVGYFLQSSITECYVSGDVSATGTVGGMVGYMEDSFITDSYTVGIVSGATVGGIAGQVRRGSVTPLITRCYTAAMINASDTSVEGIYGDANQASVMTFTLEYCYFDNTMANAANTALDYYVITGGKSTSAMIQRSTYNASWDIDGATSAWAMEDGRTYPYLTWQLNTCYANTYDFEKIEYSYDNNSWNKLTPDYKATQNGTLYIRIQNTNGDHTYNVFGTSVNLTANTSATFTITVEKDQLISIGVSSESGIIAFVPYVLPKAIDDAVKVNPGTVADIPVLDNDILDPINPVIVVVPGGGKEKPGDLHPLVPPQHGTVTANPDGTVKYTPDNDTWEGIDEFDYEIWYPDPTAPDDLSAGTRSRARVYVMVLNDDHITCDTEVLQWSMPGATYIWYDAATGGTALAAANTSIIVTRDDVNHPNYVDRQWLEVTYKPDGITNVFPNRFQVRVRFVPKAMKWTGSSGSQDYNDPANWTNWTSPNDPTHPSAAFSPALGFVPWECTDVLIPDGASAYPDLTTRKTSRTIENGNSGEPVCNNIWFENGGEIAHPDSLNYDSAHVELKIEANRWYMFSAPLQKFYTGDIYLTSPCPHDDGVALYTQLFNTPNPQTTLGGTEWTGNFNVASHLMAAGDGVSIWADDGSPYSAHANVVANGSGFWFPKKDTEYSYYYPGTNSPTGEKTGTLNRTNSHKFIYESCAKNVSNGDITIPVTAPGEVILVGNPFMAHLDFDKFFEANSGKIEWLYEVIKDAHSDLEGDFPMYRMYKKDEGSGDVIRDDSLGNLIPPMQSIILTTKSGFNGNLTFNGNMTVTSPGNNLRVSKYVPEIVTITASMGEQTNTASLIYRQGASNSFIPGEDSYKLYTEKMDDYLNDKPLVLYTSSSDGFPLEVNTFGNTDENIKLGIRTSFTGEIELDFSGVENFISDKDIFLRDLEKGAVINLRETPVYTFTKETADTELKDRFLLTFSSVTGMDNTQQGNAIVIFAEGDRLQVISNNDLLKSVQVFDLQGRLLEGTSPLSRTFTTTINYRGVYVIKAESDNSSEVKKIIIGQ
ncbi:MAG: Ig-like domain-containing protein [Candidatus Azobacteroides sp.]|nr:Ig-like domain-containing protein [Candidatus Azobacteroides sp.]